MTTDIKNCPNCGVSVENGASFCHNCGSRLEQQSAPSSEPSSGDARRQSWERANMVPKQVQLQIHFVPRRDWPLIAAAVSLILCFLMLFPSWISGDVDANAFEEIGEGPGLRIAGQIGPVLIAIIAILVLFFIALGLASGGPQYSIVALVLTSNLFVIYLVEAGVVYEYIDKGNEGGLDISMGAGIWLGLAFSFLTLFLLGLAHALRRGLVGIDVARVDADNT
ncbi:zinc-ribbon domain-containing protein [Streptomyces sp. NPDC050416]|uniref:zinc-ribbon domain-containing protein n=1 Tax=Streptomyces sp. NPDC050416 TaxID=3365611 RepID=UPI0037A0DA9B